MTTEEKELLLKDLCARLQYGVFIRIFSGDYKLLGIDENLVHLDTPVYDEGDGYFDIDYIDIKPYLRPMSSMTDNEFSELKNAYWTCPEDETYCIYGNIDWLDKNMFDYRGLTPKGLALEAKEGMYNIK